MNGPPKYRWFVPLLCAVSLPAADQTVRFNVFDASAKAGAIAGDIVTKLADVPFSVSSGALRVVALKVSGNKTVIDTGFSGNVALSLMDASDNSSPPDGQGCSPSWVPLQSLGTVTLNAGVSAPFDPTVAAAYRHLRIRIDTAPYGCSNDNFAIRPATLELAASDGDWTTPGTARALNNVVAAGGAVHGAGHPFTLTVTAKNPANGTVAGYAGSPTIDTAQTAVLLPVGGVLGAIALGSWSGGDGVMVGNAASYAEAGSITLRLVDQTFTDVDAKDWQKIADRSIYSNAAPVGRFVPADFGLQLTNAPELRTAGAGSCTPRIFTYLGQPFGHAIAPTLTVVARNAAGGTTANFRPTGGLWSLKTDLPAAPPAEQLCDAPAQSCRILRRDAGATTQLKTAYTYASTGALPGWDGSRLVVTNATLTPNDQKNPGTGTLSFSLADRIALHRPPEPQPPLDATVSLAMTLEDYAETGGASGNPPKIVGSLAATPVSFDFGPALPAGRFYYGRVRLYSANGPEQFDLNLPMQVDYWSSPTAGWRPNGDDHCTGSGTDPSGAVGLALTLPPGWPGGATCVLDVGSPGLSGAGCPETAIVEKRYTEPPAGGDFNLWLAAPGIGLTGKVLVEATVPEWLRWNWSGTFGNPVAGATFGIARKTPIIFRRELY